MPWVPGKTWTVQPDNPSGGVVCACDCGGAVHRCVNTAHHEMGICQGCGRCWYFEDLPPDECCEDDTMRL